MARPTSDGIEQLIDHLLGKRTLDPHELNELITQIANNQTSIEQLHMLRTTLTGQDSMLKARIDELLAAKQHAMAPEIDYPSYMDFGALYQQQVGQPNFWVKQQENFSRFAHEIRIWVEEKVVKYGDLPSALAPQPLAIGVRRSKSTSASATDEENVVQVLELPDPDADLVIQVGMEPLSDGKGALILQIHTYMLAHPIPQARVMLRNAERELLEINATDADGLIAFQDLARGRYTIEIKHDGQTREFSIAFGDVGSVSQSV
ncbi:carboxypeptidase-like regulatory domain-containing protein [Chloroflexi bacterium TSY]|nr:carboxypeptidase-like regulatory domain-containing protein [Chloroflexi bacterium TSY]